MANTYAPQPVAREKAATFLLPISLIEQLRYTVPRGNRSAWVAMVLEAALNSYAVDADADAGAP